MIPEQIASSAICYAYKPDVSAACQAEYPVSGEPDMVWANRGNFEGLYPGLFYGVTGLMASPAIEFSAIAMRIFSAVLCIGLVTALFLLLPLHRRSTLVWSWLISIVPLGVFTIASNNPSSWAVISGGTLWIALVGFFETAGKQRIGLAIVAVLAVLIGAGSRADAAVYAGLAAVIASILTFERSRRWWLSALLPLGVMVIAVLFYFSSFQGAVAASGSSMSSGGGQKNPLILLASNILNLPLLWAGVFGHEGIGDWGLGWLDTPMPGVVTVGALVCFGAVLFAGFKSTSLRKNLALAAVGFALLFFPLYVLYQAHAIVGAEVQPRYILPLIVMLAGVALLVVKNNGMKFSSLQRYFVATVLTVAHGVALHYNLRRYITGMDVGNWNLDADIEWWWGGFSPMLVWGLGTVAFGVTAFVVARMLSGGGRPDDKVTDESPHATDPTMQRS